MLTPSEACMRVVVNEYEAKLIELIGKREYSSFAKDVAKKSIQSGSGGYA